jgi:alkanesulfonate monooxygenase SsuD/methylene tetrahydromethanopterin reductase-like flavin-dependent oxidoreductase (luciferase family)
VAERTTRLRFGPLVWPMPLHHPLRLIEEICMLDQLSGGRLDIGFGRGAAPIELEYHGVDPQDAQEIYAEAVELVIKGLTHTVLDFEGRRFSFSGVPMELEPLQKPHPPIWYGVHAPESAERAARRGLNVVSLDPTRETRLAIERYRAVWEHLHGRGAALPKLGLGRFIVVAPSDGMALALARRAYPVWHASFTHLFRRHGRVQSHPRPPTFDLVMERGQGIAGSPVTVAEFLSSQLSATGCNYVVGQFAFGDLTLDETLQSIGLFTREAVPLLRAKASAEMERSLADKPAGASV